MSVFNTQYKYFDLGICTRPLTFEKVIVSLQ